MVWWNEKDDFCIYSLVCCPHFYYEDRLTSWHGHPSVTLLVSIWYPKYHWPLAVTSAGLPTSSVWSPWPDCCTGQRIRPLWPARLWGALTWGWKSGRRYNILNGTKGQRGLTKYFDWLLTIHWAWTSLSKNKSNVLWAFLPLPEADICWDVVRELVSCSRKMNNKKSRNVSFRDDIQCLPTYSQQVATKTRGHMCEASCRNMTELILLNMVKKK